MSLDPILLCTTILCLLLHVLLRRLYRRNAGLPPGPLGLPILGSLLSVGPSAHSGLARLASRYGPIMYLNLGTSRCVVASTAPAARAFLKVHDAQFANRPDVISAQDITYRRQNLVFANYTSKWKLLRKLCSLHLLGGRALAAWAPVRRAEYNHMIRDMHCKAVANKPIVLAEELVCALANIVGQITVSKRVFESQGHDSNEYKDMIVELLTGGGLFNIGDFVPAIAWLDLQGIQGKLKRIHGRFDGMVSKMLSDHEQKREEREREGRKDFVDVVMENRKGDEGEEISEDNVKGIIFDLFTAGTDTSAIITEWAMAELLVNPSLLCRAQSEIDTAIGRHRLLRESDLPHLPYLQAICKEAMRLHPSTPLSLPHFTFQECEVEGYRIPANTRLLVNIWAIGRDADVWEDPLAFNPERFFSGNMSFIEPHGNDFELIPFGAGRRICAGKLAGMVFVQYMLGLLVHSFDWRAVGDEKRKINMEEKFGLALPKAVPLKVFATPRLEPQAYV